MKTKTPEYKDKFLAQNPTVLDTKINSKGQTCVFYEHPTRGDEDCVYVLIDDVLADTEFFETDDFYYGSDYEPILTKDKKIICSFEGDLINKNL